MSAALLKDLQRQVDRVSADLREQAERIPEIGDRVKQMHSRADGIGRTGENWTDWLRTGARKVLTYSGGMRRRLDIAMSQSAKAAGSWLIACTFIRCCEDNDLTTHRRIAFRDASGHATSDAADAEAAWIRDDPRLTAQHWLRESFC
jgi:hypothetical protein